MDELKDAEIEGVEDEDLWSNAEDNALLETREFEEAEENNNQLRLDYYIESPEERNELVKKIIAQTPPEKLTNKYLEILADYIIFAMTKEERKNKKILTDNRMVTVNKRETSYEGLVSKLENGEDGVYNMITNDKNIIFCPKVGITEEDLAEIEPLRELKAEIEKIKESIKKATGKRKFLLKKQLIEMCQDQYVIKNSYKQPSYGASSSTIKSFTKLDLEDRISINENGIPVNDGLVSMFNPQHISALLCNYSKIKEECYGNFKSDVYYLMEDLDVIVDKALKDKYPLYYDLLIYKIDGKQNIEIQKLLEKDYGIAYSLEYLSSLWRNKIPKLIAEQAEEDYLIWYYTYKERGYWKRCSRCKQIKLGHNKFFSKNKTSKDGWYSICKCCRNAKTKDKNK